MAYAKVEKQRTIENEQTSMKMMGKCPQSPKSE